MPVSGDCPVKTYVSLSQLYRRRYFRRRFDNDHELGAALAKALCGTHPLLSFMSMWGVGAKSSPDEWDEKAMDFLQSVVEHLADSCSADAKLCLVIADSHGELNGIPRDMRLSYQTGIIDLALARGWEYVLLSEIAGSPEGGRPMISQRELYGLPYAETLIRSAEKHYHRGDAEEGARLYVAERRRENPLLEAYFDDRILLSSSDWQLRDLQPRLPCFWTWSLRRGLNNKPWFMKGAD